MATLIGRLRARPDHGPVYTVDDSDEDDFSPEQDQTTEQGEGTVGSQEVSPLTEMDKILDCETRPAALNQPDSDNVAPEQVFVKQYLVKWKGLSYLHCSWVLEEEFKKAYKSIRLLKMRVNKFHIKKESAINNGDDFLAIRPEWTTVDRIIDCRGEGNDKEYLVKYQELPYDECYWEAESDISAFHKEIQRFTNINSGTRRDIYLGNERNRKEFIQFNHTPDFVTGSLHPYQLQGLNFLRNSWSKRTHVILADEMGLGKTIQSIAFLASLFEENLAPYLVVAPLSTLRNWEREFAIWAPQMNVVMYGGNSQARSVIREYEFYFPKGHTQIKRSKQDRIKFDVLLTSYEMINSDTDFLIPIKWKCMIVDEGHRLKNKDSKLFSSMKQFKSKHRVLLTGTPLQNNLDELFVLLNFLDPVKFGSLEDFQMEFNEINREDKIFKLHHILAPHLLRRVKKDVLKDIPPKRELILRVDLSFQQKELYKDVLTRNYENLAKKRAAKRSNVFMELRKVCLHPYMVEGIVPVIEDRNEAFKQLVESSGKLQLLDKMMVKLKEQGRRVLIYTQFQNMLDLLEDYCAYKNWFYERIDGRVGGAERQVRIGRFNVENSNRFCFLLSTRAGGLGINLATADTVIIFDSDWNPHADLQAMARAHRLGQKNKVMIYRLANRATVEEAMMQMTKKKLLLEHLVVGNLKTQNLTQEELDDIIRFGSKELFSDENVEARKSGKINYDDAAIEKLLDRDHVDPEEVSVDAEESNDFLKAFQVANLLYIEETKVAEKAHAVENNSLEGNADREKYWDELLKDKYEVQQAKELNALGTRKRNCKQILEEEDDFSGLELSSDGTEPSAHETEISDDDDETAGQGNQMRRKPYKRMARDNSEPIPLAEEGEWESLIVRGFNKKQRNIFKMIFLRYGVGNYDWKEYVPHLKRKTYEEIRGYGILFLKHISEDTTDDSSPTYSDGIPKEGLNSDVALLRIALLMGVMEKVKLAEEDSTKPLFPERILERFPVLTNVTHWNEEHDKLLLRGITTHGLGRWVSIVDDKGLGIQEQICKELNIPLIMLYNDQSKDKGKKLSDFLRKRFQHLEKAMNYECAEEYYYGRNASPATRAEQAKTETQVGASVNVEAAREQLPRTDPIIISDIISAAAVDNKQERTEVAQPYNQMGENLNIGTDGDVEMKEAAEDVAVNREEAEVIVLSD